MWFYFAVVLIHLYSLGNALQLEEVTEKFLNMFFYLQKLINSLQKPHMAPPKFFFTEEM